MWGLTKKGFLLFLFILLVGGVALAASVSSPGGGVAGSGDHVDLAVVPGGAAGRLGVVPADPAAEPVLALVPRAAVGEVARGTVPVHHVKRVIHRVHEDMAVDMVVAPQGKPVGRVGVGQGGEGRRAGVPHPQPEPPTVVPSSAHDVNVVLRIDRHGGVAVDPRVDRHPLRAVPVGVFQVPVSAVVVADGWVP